MSRHHYPRCDQHSQAGKRDRRCKGPGFISSTLKGVADKLGIAKGWVILAFVMLFLSSFLLGLAAFGLAYYWLKHPGQLENLLDQGAEKFRRLFDRDAPAAYAGDRPAAAQEHEPEFQFSELRRKFEDLERRAGTMEAHVASEEYTLNRKFKEMKDADDNR